ncbi:MAG: polyprenyl synthetase family protein [Planctomycetota bacterium]|jgi:geranylgeranyl diphosphate synthase type II
MAMTENNSNFQAKLAQAVELVNNTLAELVVKYDDIQDGLKKAIEYTLGGGGKRIRAAIVLWSCELVAGTINNDAKTAAAAVEMVHAYSLVHDDLPAMDDDDMRRGRATCHVAFDEATAILTGDALLTLTFEVLAKEISNSGVAVKMIGQLAEAAGPSGMVGGQLADLKAANSGGDRELLEYIHTNKTAKMFRAAAQMGALAAGADIDQLRALSEYGLRLGLGFQVADDILDVISTSEQLGKTAGKDLKGGKLTYPGLLGLEAAQELEAELADEAVKALDVFDEKADALRNLARSLVARTY